MATEDKQKRLALTIQKLNKEHGAGSVGMFNDMPDITVDVIPTGSLGIDCALGIGGLAKGRIVEIFGPESSGKTTLTLHAIAECQKKGDICAFIDAEHALDPVYAAALGVDLDALVLSQPSSGEQGLNIVEELIVSGSVDMIVVDSVSALTPKAEIDGEIGDHHVGSQARMISQACRKLASVVSKNNVCLVFINQIRQKIGVMFGSNETTSGGRALAFYASQRIDIRKISTIKQGDEAIGCRTRVKIIKNKLAPPARQTEFEIRFGKGINKLGEVFDTLVQMDLVEKSGAWFKYEGETIAQGRDAALEWLEKDPVRFAEFEVKAREFLGLG